MSRHLLATMCIAGACATTLVGAPQQGAPDPLPAQSAMTDVVPTMQELTSAATRLPLAALLGAALALRPRRRGTPPRKPEVVQTQIVLAGVGALIMLVIGASLARAFGIVGAANLIRYRSKIEDPKDAVVMLCALAVGLASGVGLYVLAVAATALLVALLWVIESFEPLKYKTFELTVAVKKEAEGLRPQVERVLRSHRWPFEVRTLSADELSYEVRVPHEVQTDAISTTLVNLAPKSNVAVDWNEKKPKTA